MKDSKEVATLSTMDVSPGVSLIQPASTSPISTGNAEEPGIDGCNRRNAHRGPTAQAIGYALNHWDGLERFLEDGRIELDSNTVERAMRSVALSRKNSLFAGSDEGAANWAAIASLVETCKLNAVEPQGYLTELLTRLVNGWPQARIDELMPWHWATSTPH